jgi:Domain of unknown function (DUF4186)
MAKREKKPLGITCTSSDCENGLHCFRQAKKRGEQKVVGGRCRDCGADLVNWPRLHSRSFQDADYTVRALHYELIRHHFWHEEFDVRAMNYARRKGINGLAVAAERRVRRSLAPADPPFDGRQTGKSGNPLFYAQHACAVCCRKCMEYWHGIEQHRPLSEEEIGYFKELLLVFVKERLPKLSTDGEYVPPLRRGHGE